jgi:cobalt/nickel transport system permease protein
MNFLALTTPLVDLVDLFRRWHVPTLLIDLMTVIYRFIFVLLDSFNRMYTAQESRLGYSSSFYRSLVNAGLLGSRLFIDAYQRSRRLQVALASRNFSGDLRVLPASYESSWTVVAASVAVGSSMVLVWVLL